MHVGVSRKGHSTALLGENIQMAARAVVFPNLAKVAAADATVKEL